MLQLFKWTNLSNFMKIGEALSQLKKEKIRLTRLISLRRDNVYTEEGRKTSFDPKKLSGEINKKIDDIRELKIKIQKTNLSTKVEGDNIKLAEAIIKVSDLKNNIEDLSKLFERKKSIWSSDKDEKIKVSQLDEVEVESEIERLESEKVKLDNKIQITNWKTDLMN